MVGVIGCYYAPARWRVSAVLPSPDLAMTSKAQRRFAGLGIFLLVVGAAALLIVPMWLIRPFAPQTERGIEVAYWLRRLGPALAIVALLAGAALAVVLWRRARWWSRLALVPAVLLLAGAAWAVRINVFEAKMFAPLADTRMASADEASWVADDDVVLAVTVGAESVAYPLRIVAYHHVVHDVVGGVPIVATY